MKKWILILFLIAGLLAFTACSAPAANVNAGESSPEPESTEVPETAENRDHSVDVPEQETPGNVAGQEPVATVPEAPEAEVPESAENRDHSVDVPEQETPEDASSQEPVATVPEAPEVEVPTDALYPTSFSDFFSVSSDPSFEEISYEGSTADWLCYSPLGLHYGFEDDYWEGCSVWCAIQSYSTSASASSVLEPDAPGVSYKAGNVVNGSRQNAWVEGVEGHGLGEYLDVTSQYTTGSGYPIDLKTLCIANGYSKNENIWLMNGRVKLFKLYFNGSYVATIYLQDTMKPQYIDISSLGLQVASGEVFTLRFEIAGVYSGTQFADTAVTGIALAFYTPNH